MTYDNTDEKGATMPVPLLPNQWQVFVGILVESTVTKNQRWFHIYVPEFLPTKTGNVSMEDGSFSVSMYNEKTGKTEETEVSISSTIYADYFGVISGFDVPTMYRNMQVIVVNRISTDKWYWIPLERDDSYKTFEHFRVSCADIAQTNKTTTAEKDDIEGRDAGLTNDNTYFLEIDTKYRKHVLLSTSSSDGEQWRYFFKIDADAHTVELWDNCMDRSQLNNSIKIESRPDINTKGRITIQNAAGNTIVMTGEDTEINIPRNLLVNIGGDVQITGNGNLVSKIVKDLHHTVAGNESVRVLGSVNRVISGNNEEIVSENQSVTVGKTHRETQMVRTTVAKTSATMNTTNYSLTANISNFTFMAWSIVSTTINTTVTTWALQCKQWLENAESVAGTVVALIRGKHH